MDLTPNNLYIALSARNVEGSYHWGILQPTSHPTTTCIYSHATISSATNGKWLAQTISQPIPMTERALILIWRIGPFSPAAKFNEVTERVPADGKPSARTGKEFNCRTWVFDFLAKLHEEAVLKLGVDIDEIERKAFQLANGVENDVVAGKRAPLVVNDDWILGV